MQPPRRERQGRCLSSPCRDCRRPVNPRSKRKRLRPCLRPGKEPGCRTRRKPLRQ
jgi:hypothetical protein